MIMAQNITKAFGGFTALNDMSLHAPQGSVYGLVGPNGAGKTTVIRCLAGVYRPDSGSAEIAGQPVWENPAVKARLAYIPDDVFYFTSATVEDMKKYYAGIYPTFDSQRWQALGPAFNLPPKTPIRRMSRGMQKQVAFRLALSMRPEVLILDEPVDGLDPVMRRQVWGLVLSDVAEHGVTVFVSSHNLRELEDVCDHVGIIHQGSVHIQRSLSQLQDGVVKVQAAFADGHTPDFSALSLLHHSVMGRVHSLIIRGRRDQTDAQLRSLSPIFYDLLPLTLEEIFIYEMGGADYAVKDLAL